MRSTVERVEQSTKPEINQRIHEATEARVSYYTEYPERIAERLRELDEEWDIERTLEANAAALALTGTILAATRHRGWLLLPLTVSGFLLQHAIQGWCPPVEVFRRLGVRTPREIERERNALKALRGDYDGIAGVGNGRAALAAAERLHGGE